MKEESKKCLVCTELFFRKKNYSNKQWFDFIFCSRKCYGKKRKGIALSKITIEKIRKAHMGKKMSIAARNKMSITSKKNGNGKWMKGRKMSEETKRKISLAVSGEKSCMWKGGLMFRKKAGRSHLDSAYRGWMFAVKNRDSWKCKIANENCKGRLEAHHILNWVDYPELRYEINNGITLCHAHHPRKWTEEKRLSPYFQNLVLNVKNE